MPEFEPPDTRIGDARELLAGLLSTFRVTVVRKAEALSEADLRASRLPSSWTPIQLLSHVAHMERRWVVWGFLGEDVPDPWGDRRDDAWYVDDGTTLDEVVAMLREVGARTDGVLRSTPLDTLAPDGPRFDGEPTTLGWIGFHVLQEYARHAGHLDIAVELAGGPQGE
jgi:uncharacterized damage-inducible protein DinB